MSSDLFQSGSATPTNSYDASSIEVLEGLEPVRRRPGMYIGGTDERALHHLAAEILDNAMDEAVAEHASRIEVTLEPGNRLTITDNGRGIPTDPHPKFPDKSALEVIFSTLHAGGKFSGKAYATSGGLHGVGSSVVNALSTDMVVEVARDRQLYRQRFNQGVTLGPIEHVGTAPNRRGTSVAFTPDTEIFGEMHFKPARLYKLARSKAYLFAGVEIRWKCAPELISDDTPAEAVFQFPGGLADHLKEQLGTREGATAEFFSGSQDFPGEAQGRVEWAVAWPLWSDGSYSWYCNTIPTPDGGSHEQGLRQALVRGIRAFGELVGQKKAKDITADDIMVGSELMLSVFIRDPQFQRPADLTRGHRPGRKGGARPFRPFPHRQDGARQGAAQLCARADGRSPAPQAGARGQAQDRDQRPQAAPARQADRLFRRRSCRDRVVHRRR